LLSHCQGEGEEAGADRQAVRLCRRFVYEEANPAANSGEMDHAERSGAPAVGDRQDGLSTELEQHASRLRRVLAPNEGDMAGGTIFRAIEAQDIDGAAVYLFAGRGLIEPSAERIMANDA